jgi:hypothetical protein
MKNATGGQKYDFKQAKATDGSASNNTAQRHYRGLFFDGKISSARDIGNYGAGFVAGIKGLSWLEARAGFDALETYQRRKMATEGQPTKRAEAAGYSAGNAIYRKKMIRYEK